jgi:predicted signal transduction protein with EAL and GGDEF domain
VARLGGDEFTVLLEGILDVKEATDIAERISEQMRVPFMVGKQQVFTCCSIGIALSSSSQDSPHDLLRNADIAMYEAKNRGKSGYVVFNPSMNSRVAERMAMENDLRRAVEQNEFVVYYQPIVDLATGCTVELEALIRWQHPVRGLVPPLEFIPLAEETGLILDNGQFVLEEACRQVKRWHDLFPGKPRLVLTVNLSGRQLEQPDMVDTIVAVLDRTGFDPRYLKLEITETIALQSINSTLASLQELRELGIHLALDDFGTGYSALNYLKHYPIDTLKIDRSFVAGVGTNPEDTAIVYAVLAFARTLKLNVTAEGIETRAQLKKLRDLGCQRGQGYYFSRPLPTETIISLLGTNQLLNSERLAFPPDALRQA